MGTSMRMMKATKPRKEKEPMWINRFSSLLASCMVVNQRKGHSMSTTSMTSWVHARSSSNHRARKCGSNKARGAKRGKEESKRPKMLMPRKWMLFCPRTRCPSSKWLWWRQPSQRLICCQTTSINTFAIGNSPCMTRESSASRSRTWPSSCTRRYLRWSKSSKPKTDQLQAGLSIWKIKAK